MRRFLTETASTKRPPAISSGKRGTPATKISSLKCTPLDPVDPELRQRLAINTPHELLQTFVNGGLDILEGDFLVYGATDYPIRSCAEWKWRGVVFQRLILEDLKR
jgi:hypothetical protein